MFENARLKLTAYYLVIIMTVSIVFSGVIYKELTFDLDRIERFQRFRSPILDEIRDAIIIRLSYINLVVLVVSGGAGYYLAGKTLRPIQENMEEQKQFVANASHELRTPLTSLKSELEVSLRDPKVKNKEILRSNLEDVNKMQKLTDYLLRQNKFQNNERLEMKQFNLKEVVQKVSKKFKVETELVDVRINGNESAISELATILIDNAVKYGGKVKKPIVRVGKGKVLEVQDFGVGIPASDLPHIFERFYRGDKARGADGYGLGLSIAKSIADMHGARIKVASKLNSGTTFKVVFS